MTDRFGVQEIIQLTDRAVPPTGVINTTVLDRAISDATAEINAALAGRYSLPLAVVPEVLARVACNLSRYHLYDVPPEDVRKRYDDGLRFLRDVASGKITMGVDSAGAQATPSDGAETQSAGSVFARNLSTGYV